MARRPAEGLPFARTSALRARPCSTEVGTLSRPARQRLQVAICRPSRVSTRAPMIPPGASDALSRTLLLTRDLVHNAKVTDDQIVRVLQETTVCIVADAANASTSSGQATVTTLA